MQVLNYVNVDYDNDGVPDAFSARVLNVGQADGSGVEATTTVALSDNFMLYLAASYLDTEATGLQEICAVCQMSMPCISAIRMAIFLRWSI